MTRSAAWVAITAACLTGGCATSPAMRYYTLTDIAPQTRLTAAPDTVPVRLDRVNLPSELDRLQLVRRIDATRLQISEFDRWAAPLDEMIRRVLSSDLAARLPADLVADPNEPAPGEPRQSLSVDVQEFYADASCTIALRAVWVVKPSQGEAAQARSRQSSEDVRIAPSGSCSGSQSLAEAMSQALAQLSDRMAAGIAKPLAAGR